MHPNGPPWTWDLRSRRPEEKVQPWKTLQHTSELWHRKQNLDPRRWKWCRKRAGQEFLIWQCGQMFNTSMLVSYYPYVFMSNSRSINGFLSGHVAAYFLWPAPGWGRTMMNTTHISSLSRQTGRVVKGSSVSITNTEIVSQLLLVWTKPACIHWLAAWAGCALVVISCLCRGRGFS